MTLSSGFMLSPIWNGFVYIAVNKSIAILP